MQVALSQGIEQSLNDALWVVSIIFHNKVVCPSYVIFHARNSWLTNVANWFKNVVKMVASNTKFGETVCWR